MASRTNVKSTHKPLITRVRPSQPKANEIVSTNSTESTTSEPLSSLSTATLITDLSDSFAVATKAKYVDPYIPRLYSSIPGMSRPTTGRQASSPVLKLDTGRQASSPVLKLNTGKETANTSKKATFYSKISLPYKIIGVIALLLILCAAVIPPVILLTRKSSSTANTTSASVCSVTTCIKSITSFHENSIAYWPFDSTTTDRNSLYTGLPFNSPTYSGSPIISGQCIQFDSTGTQYVSMPFIDLTYKSFTIQAWIYPRSITGEQGIFGECASTLLADQCLSISIKNGHLHMSLNLDTEIFGSSVLVTSAWYHVTFVYDYSLLQLSIYYNGVLDASSASLGVSGPYVGSTGTFTTSKDKQFVEIDEIICECWVTISGYYPLDSTTQPYLDYSLNFINAFTSQTTSVTGKVNQALLFNLSSAYFITQIFGIHNGNPPFTIAFWMSLTSITSGTIIHVSQLLTGSTVVCFDLLVLTSSGTLVAQTYNSNYGANNMTTVQSSVLKLNSWTHVTFSYSQPNGMRLYLNGALNAYTTGTLSMSSFNAPLFLTFGNSMPGGGVPSGCYTGTIPVVPGQLLGSMDELYVYCRELNQNEICTLANP
ncbi:unnamed protein product [Didymodactylos carnosus]|uniref:Concanavalin A-like lectin/glucanase n=1 Tax=Didymodactylos carnosus TaxID=1234261 RepID=A0A8S2HBJ8_9BILA|nr:unnamed protein product [Didymodactylos carnosus]CAF3624459.1 unnamed protein product [Didymodactylos carnosus]